MPRGAQVIYPKDLGPSSSRPTWAPVSACWKRGWVPGPLHDRAAGRGVGVGYELREDFAERARSNVFATLGPEAPYRVEIRDVTEG